MPKLRSSTLRRAFAPKALKTAFRDRGDAARDGGRWDEAAAAYRRHLVLSPRDAAIWVQLGHALKESGQHDAAIAAYGRGLVLTPADPDLLLNLGHAHKLAGEPAKAIAFYRRSMAIDGNSFALAEVGELVAQTGGAGDLLDKKAVGRLAQMLVARCDNLRPVAASAIEIVGGSGLRLIAPDPWIEFTVEPYAVAGVSLALLTIEIAPIDTIRSLDCQIYVDQGGGYEERLSVNFSPIGGRADIVIVHPAKIERIRFDPNRLGCEVTMPSLSLRRLNDASDLAAYEQPDAPSYATSTVALVRELISKLRLGNVNSVSAPVLIPLGTETHRGITYSHNYDFWRLTNEMLSRSDYGEIARLTAAFAYRPTFSFVMPTYNTPIDLLVECMDSMLAQTYPHFEVCVADDNSPNSEVAETIAEYARLDPRVQFVRRPANGHISAASNSALALATGDFVALMDHDDLIPDYALFVMADYLNKTPDADILFSDEDKITSAHQRVEPYFKGEFNKYLMYGHNMVSHLGVYRRSLVERVGGFRLGLEGSQDYDLFLRCYEQTSDERVVHVPHVLYHWRQVPGSTAISADQKSYALLAAQQAINGHFERTAVPLRSTFGFSAGNTGVRPSCTFDTRTSIIIPTRNGLDLLKPCVNSILDRPQDNIEILIVDNGSDDPEALAYFDELAERGQARILRYPDPFNYSLINNFAAREASGDILCFLNNDTEVQSPDWIDRARAFLSMDEIGAVGARLLYPDGVLQHFGIGIGMSEHGVAGIPHAGYPPGHSGYFSKARLIQEVSAVTAACLFMRSSDFATIGGFEPELQVAYNDVDLCLKIRALGLRILVDPDITLIHKESRTRGSDRDGENARRLDREAAWMHERWGDTLARDPYLSPNIDLMRGDFALDFAPRVPFPWKRADRPSSPD